jgi:hypothetical protein
MSNNSLKTPLSKSLPELTQKKILDAMHLTGKSLPCHVISVDGAIVTVAFDVSSDFTLPQVTVPLFGPEYIRYPIQSGDKGAVIAFDARLGGNSGLGSGVPDLSQPANLTALVFLPFGNTEWASVDPDAVTIYGPNGVVLRDTGSNCTFVLTPTTITIVAPDSYTVTSGTTQFQLTPSGWSLNGPAGNLQDSTAHTSPAIMHNAWSTFVTWLNSHQHVTGGGSTGAPVSPFTGSSIAPS